MHQAELMIPNILIWQLVKRSKPSKTYW